MIGCIGPDANTRSTFLAQSGNPPTKFTRSKETLAGAAHVEEFRIGVVCIVTKTIAGAHNKRHARHIAFALRGRRDAQRVVRKFDGDVGLLPV